MTSSNSRKLYYFVRIYIDKKCVQTKTTASCSRLDLLVFFSREDYVCILLQGESICITMKHVGLQRGASHVICEETLRVRGPPVSCCICRAWRLFFLRSICNYLTTLLLSQWLLSDEIHKYLASHVYFCASWNCASIRYGTSQSSIGGTKTKSWI